MYPLAYVHHLLLILGLIVLIAVSDAQETSAVAHLKDLYGKDASETGAPRDSVTEAEPNPTHTKESTSAYTEFVGRSHLHKRAVRQPKPTKRSSHRFTLSRSKVKKRKALPFAYLKPTPSPLVDAQGVESADDSSQMATGDFTSDPLIDPAPTPTIMTTTMTETATVATTTTTAMATPRTSRGWRWWPWKSSTTTTATPTLTTTTTATPTLTTTTTATPTPTTTTAPATATAPAILLATKPPPPNPLLSVAPGVPASSLLNAPASTIRPNPARSLRRSQSFPTLSHRIIPQAAAAVTTRPNPVIPAEPPALTPFQISENARLRKKKIGDDIFRASRKWHLTDKGQKVALLLQIKGDHKLAPTKEEFELLKDIFDAILVAIVPDGSEGVTHLNTFREYLMAYVEGYTLGELGLLTKEEAEIEAREKAQAEAKLEVRKKALTKAERVLKLAQDALTSIHHNQNHYSQKRKEALRARITKAKAEKESMRKHLLRVQWEEEDAATARRARLLGTTLFKNCEYTKRSNDNDESSRSSSSYRDRYSWSSRFRRRYDYFGEEYRQDRYGEDSDDDDYDQEEQSEDEDGQRTVSNKVEKVRGRGTCIGPLIFKSTSRVGLWLSGLYTEDKKKMKFIRLLEASSTEKDKRARREARRKEPKDDVKDRLEKRGKNPFRSESFGKDQMDKGLENDMIDEPEEGDDPYGRADAKWSARDVPRETPRAVRRASAPTPHVEKTPVKARTPLDYFMRDIATRDEEEEGDEDEDDGKHGTFQGFLPEQVDGTSPVRNVFKARPKAWSGLSGIHASGMDWE